VWWAEVNQRPELRLCDLVLELAKERSETYDAMRARMTPHIISRAADL
jgi:hypothetical protein